MKAIGLAIIGCILLVLVYFLLSGMAQVSDAEAQRIDAAARLQDAYGRAQSSIIQSQGQARLDSAQAFAVTAGAAYPWLVTGLLGMSGLVLIVAIVAMLVLAVRVTQVNRQDRLLLAMAMQGLLPEKQDYLALQAPERERVIEL